MHVMKKISGTHDAILHESESSMESRVAWPRAAITIVGVSLVLWGVVAVIFSAAIG